jgi:AcrR family transcriptional regulator
MSRTVKRGMRSRAEPQTPRRRSETHARDVEGTKRRLIAAVGTLLARDGFAAIGVNAVAKEAAADKALVYRYFGGMDGLLAEFAKETCLVSSPKEDAAKWQELARLTPVERAVAVMRGYVRELRRRPLVAQVLAWGLFDEASATDSFHRVRERKRLELLAALERELPPGSDAAGLMALFSAAFTYLALRASKTRKYGGLDLRSDATWDRLEELAATLIRAHLDGSRVAHAATGGTLEPSGDGS